MTRKLDPDVKALAAAIRGLDQSTSLRMLRVNLEFLWDRYIGHPSAAIRKHFEAAERGEAGGSTE